MNRQRYWYLYALFFIFLVTPTFGSVKMAVVGLVVAIVAKLLILWGGGGSVYAVSTVLSNEIWFVLGINICAFDIRLKGKKLQGMVCGLLFVILSVIVYVTDIHSSAVSFAMGLLACTAVILLVAGFEDKCSRGMSFLAKYTMPIFLMHTLFAAPLRSVLLKVGITNAECGSSCGNRTGYQFCGTCRCGMDYETNKVARVLSVSE